MKYKGFLKTAGGFLLRNALPLIILFAVAGAFFAVSAGADGAGGEREMEIVRDSVVRAAVSCYALEGRYPESYEYLKQNYRLLIDEEKYRVIYEVFAENIMPSILVVRREP